MKKCKFCGSELELSAKDCPNCGSSDFIYVCDSCGQEFDDRVICPNCHIQVGTPPKICPRCHKAFYGKSCECGYTVPLYSANEAVAKCFNGTSLKPALIWIFAFIFCAPLAGMLLIFTRGDYKKIPKTLVVSVLSLIALMVISNILFHL